MALEIRNADLATPSWKTAPLEKHKKYLSAYKANDFFWGVGIEQETYIELSGNFQVLGSYILNNHKRERYSVDYFSNYKPTLLKKALKTRFKPTEYYKIPLLINSHSFIHADRNENHRTTYETVPKPNPAFSGRTLFEDLQRTDSYFLKEFEKTYLFDGDTIEFATQKFYKGTVEDAVEELTAIRKKFIKKLNGAAKKLNFYSEFKFIYPADNYPFASYLTNTRNIGIFNNGTYNINLTIPTKLNAAAEIEDWQLFKEQHRRAIRFFQWIEPLLLIVYGSSDSCIESGSKSSQRCAVSRYISIGTFDSNEMPRGKVLQQAAETIRVINNEDGWYNQFYKNCPYERQPNIGFDINFNKHKNHGIELRFFDNFEVSRLLPLLYLLVDILDFAVKTEKVRNPIDSYEWNTFTADAMRQGKDLIISDDILIMYEEVFGTVFSLVECTAEKMLATIRRQIHDPIGICNTHLIRKRSALFCC
jgi:hypothetical protein